jgi:hypothetical protein
MNSMKGLMLALLCASLINVSATAQEAPKSSKFTPWKPIAMKDILWRRRELKEVDARVQANAAFLPTNNQAQPNLADQLMFGALSGKITAYYAVDDRFTTKLTADELANLIRTSGARTFNKYLVKEDSLCVGPGKKLTVRIVGIAPVTLVKDEKGNSVEKPLFWIYYPDSREFLSQCPAATGNTLSNWDTVFETRQFSGKVIKSFDRDYTSVTKK